MSSHCCCPTCRQPIDVTACEPGVMVSCPNCGSPFQIPAITTAVDHESPAAFAPRPSSPRTSTRTHHKRTPVTTVALLASVGLLLIVGVLVLAMSGGDGSSSGPHVAAVNTATHHAKETARPATGLPSGMARDTRRSGSGKAAAEPAKHASEPADPAATSGSTDGLTATNDEPAAEAGTAAPAAEQSNTALANAILAAQRPVSGDPEQPSSKPDVAGSPQDYPATAPPPASAGKAADLSLEEKRRMAEMAKLRKLVYRHFAGTRRLPDRSRGTPDDFFVVAKFEMPVSTRAADLRFEISSAVEPSVDLISDYLTSTPSGVMRDFQVVARYGSMADATEGVAEARKRYDQAREYQAQLLAYLQAQQRIQASSIRRC